MALLGACQNPTEPQEAAPHAVLSHSKPILSAAKTDSTSTTTAAHYDTLQASNNTILHFIPGKKTDFAAIGAAPEPVAAESPLIRRQASGRVQREGNTLALLLSNGKSVVFTNDTYQLRNDENEELDKYYSYCGNLPGLPYWIVQESLYEAQTTVLVNQQTGAKTAITGEIALSPDHTHLLAFYAGMTYEDDVHDLQLFAINRQAVQLRWRKSLPAWAPNRTRWLDNRTIAIEQLHPEARDSIHFSQPTYIRLLLP